ncbi:MAG TPA: AAA family ATPase, partial [Acidimicrobiales bacterium]|nr:AAA family ATPase [Acidimicrobiales bacterium]
EEQGTEGDSFFVAFDRAGDACAAALGVQAGLRAECWPRGERISVRIGLHSGEVSRTSDQDALVGFSIHLAARIAAAGHGGQILLSEATRLLAEDALPPGASVLPLGSHLLKDIERPVVLYQLSVPSQMTSFPPLHSLEAVHHNLPAPATSYVGGPATVATVSEVVGTSRLVTLTGAGGCGKTRLALEVGRHRLEAHRDGVWFVELGSTTDGDRVAHAVAEALELRPESEQAVIHALVTYLKRLETLVVVDNCEHLVDDCCSVVGTLLRECAGVRVLATSREPLGLDGETTWRVASLDVPPAAEDDPSSAAIVASASVELFVARARAADPELSPTTADMAAIASICRRLDGLPLAIELAAARASVMTVTELAARLERSFKVLSGGRRGALPRQQTIDAAVDWSYGLLNDDERLVLRRLSVFRRGATMDAAEAVCADPDDDVEVFEVLAGLVRKSLVQRERTTVATRYRMLEPVRQFALARLMAEEDAAGTRDRHRDYFLSRAIELGRRFDGGRLDGALHEYLNEVENFRGAFEWAAAVGPLEAVVRIVAGLGAALGHVASADEREAMCREALAIDPSIAPDARIDVLYTASIFRMADDAAKRFIDEAQELAERIGDEGAVLRMRVARWGMLSSSAIPGSGEETKVAAELERLRPEMDKLTPSWRARYLYGLAFARHRIGDRAGAGAALAEGQALGADAGLAECYLKYLAGTRAHLSGEETEAVRCWDAAVAVCDREGPMHAQCYVLKELGDLRLRNGEVEGGLALLRQSAGIARRRAAVPDIGMLAGHLARALVDLDRLDDAQPLITELLEMTKGFGFYARAETLLAAGLLAERLDNRPEAIRYFEEATTLARPPHLFEELQVIASEALARLSLGGQSEPSS